MNTIWKYEISPGQAEYYMPAGAEILCAREQHDGICVWAKVDTAQSENLTPRKIMAFGTGHAMPDVPMRYLGTASLEGGALIFHAFEILSGA